MTDRLSSIITRGGDAGTTGLGDGSRVSKNADRIHALGDVDELNCIIGLLRCESLPEGVDAFLAEVQHDLFGTPRCRMERTIARAEGVHFAWRVSCCRSGPSGAGGMPPCRAQCGSAGRVRYHASPAAPVPEPPV